MNSVKMQLQAWTLLWSFMSSLKTELRHWLQILSQWPWAMRWLWECKSKPCRQYLVMSHLARMKVDTVFNTVNWQRWDLSKDFNRVELKTWAKYSMIYWMCSIAVRWRYERSILAEPIHQLRCYARGKRTLIRLLGRDSLGVTAKLGAHALRSSI